MNAALAKPKGFEVFWSTHAAKRTLQRGFDPAVVLEAVAHLFASGVMTRRATEIRWGKMRVVAALSRESKNRVIIVTVKHTRNSKRTRNQRNKRDRKRDHHAQ